MARKPDELRKRYFLSLDSPGGDLREAIKLARLVRDVGFTTIVEKDARCISACFMLYAAGFTRLGQQGEQPFSHPAISTIGVHRAFIDPEVMKRLGPAEAREVVRASVTISTAALREFDVPEPIIALMQATPASGVRFLTSDQLNTFAETPWLVDLAHARCGLVIPADSAGFKQGLEYETKLASCKLDVLVEHHSRKFPRTPAS